MSENISVKQLNEILQEMRKIYKFDDEKTKICTRNLISGEDEFVTIFTTDEDTGIEISMSKRI